MCNAHILQAIRRGERLGRPGSTFDYGKRNFRFVVFFCSVPIYGIGHVKLAPLPLPLAYLKQHR